MFKRLVSAMEKACICHADYDEAYALVEEARANNLITHAQFELLTNWIVGNMVHRSAALGATS